MAFKASSDSPCYCVVGLSRSASDTAEISLRRILGTLLTTAVKGEGVRGRLWMWGSLIGGAPGAFLAVFFSDLPIKCVEMRKSMMCQEC